LSTLYLCYKMQKKSPHLSWLKGLWIARREEAQELLGREVTASEAALELGSLCSLAAITDGPNGSYISALGRLQVGRMPLIPVIIILSPYA
jgi:hypothetical protein